MQLHMLVTTWSPAKNNLCQILNLFCWPSFTRLVFYPSFLAPKLKSFLCYHALLQATFYCSVSPLSQYHYYHMHYCYRLYHYTHQFHWFTSFTGFTGFTQLNTTHNTTFLWQCATWIKASQPPWDQKLTDQKERLATLQTAAACCILVPMAFPHVWVRINRKSEKAILSSSLWSWSQS